MALRLEKPEPRHESAWQDIVQEIQGAGERVVPYSLTMELDDYGAFLAKTRQFSQGDNLGGMVRSDTFFLVDTENPDRILGAINLRYGLNEYLARVGGHIGYGVRPSERQKGYASRMLALALPKCKEEGIPRVLLTCETWNRPSAQVIQKNGGVLEGTVRDGDKEFARYWIEV